MGKFTKISLMIPMWMLLSCASSFNYQNFNSWIAISPLCGNGKRQSPIDLGPESKTKNGLPIDVKNYDAKLSNVTVFNAGHTVKITGDWGKNIPTVTGTLTRNALYLLEEIHLHWSDEDDSGTDHSINGKRYACELHLIHFNSKYRSAKNASSKADGSLVVGFLYKNDKETPNPGLVAVSNLMATVKEVRSKSAGVLDLSLFGIQTIKSFYAYDGSLTSPPCTENILWVVANELFSTNTAIMKQIRSTQLSDNDKSNVRPVQPLNGREVVLYKK